MRNLIVLASLVGCLVFVATLVIPTPVQAQRNQRQQQISTYVCKSGHHVNGPKGCKENGGKW